MTTPTPTLGYADPAVFYAGVYRHRSAAAVLCMAALACFGVAAGWAAYAGPMRVPLLRVPLYGLAAVLLLGVGYLAATAAADRADAVRITEDGIEDGRRFWPWARVGSVFGLLAGGMAARRNGVVIGFTVDRFGVPFPHTLLATPALTVGQYAQLAAFLSRAHPHVAVDPQPRRSEG